METNFAALSEELAGTVERAAGFLVAVHARPRITTSGIHWRDGFIVTADHGIQREEDIRVTLPNGDTVAAQLKGRDPGTDIAVLEVQTKIERTPETIAQARPGELILVTGRHAENGPSASMGIVSLTGGPWRTWRGGRMDSLIRLDIGLYPGLSGGAVLNAKGQALGLATSGLTRYGAVTVTCATIDRVLGELVEHGQIRRGYLGVGLQPIQLPDHLKKQLGVQQHTALLLLSVEPGGPAHQTGLTIGDILLRVNQTDVTDVEDLQNALTADSIGQSHQVTFARGGEAQVISVTAGERPRRS
jgi:S1-C subfamily serine protease